MEIFNPEELLQNVDDIEAIKHSCNNYLHDKAVLGIDIYKYSTFPLCEQVYVPVVFDKLYEITTSNIIECEKFNFNCYGSKIDDFKQNFISTGDGGYQFFDNPLQAILFAIYFQANVQRYISGGSPVEFMQKLHKIIDSIELRYAITYDQIYYFKTQYYGPAIISNARILSKDSLNRLLVDSNTINWFTNTINAVENLLDLDKATLLLTRFFKDCDLALPSNLFDKGDMFKSVDVLKIGQIEAKATTLDIYNLHLQVLLSLDTDKHDYDRYLLTLGNLNTTGIN